MSERGQIMISYRTANRDTADELYAACESAGRPPWMNYRGPVAPESFDPEHPVRVLSDGRRPHVFRIFFTVDHTASLVHVVHVRRGARQRPTVHD